METYRSTRQVARLLGVSVSRLTRSVWEGRVDEPPRGPSGSFLWRREDIERASWALLRRELGDVLADREAGRGGR